MAPESIGEAKKALEAIMVVDEIPVTAGTVNAVALPVPELADLLPYQAPATPRQEVPCEMFAQVLGVAKAG